MIFSIILYSVLQVQAHELVAPVYHNHDISQDGSELSVMQLYALFSKSRGIILDLPDGSFTATATLSSTFLPKYARIDETEVHGNGHGNGIAWAGKVGSQNVLAVDMKTSYLVTGVAVQGRADAAQWVKRFSVLTSENGSKWVSQGTFNGNFDHLSVCRVRFKSPVLARFVKFIVLQYHGYPCMRVDVLVYDANKE